MANRGTGAVGPRLEPASPHARPAGSARSSPTGAGASIGVSMDMLLRMQAWYDASRMRARAGEIDVRRYEPA